MFSSVDGVQKKLEKQIEKTNTLLTEGNEGNKEMQRHLPFLRYLRFLLLKISLFLFFVALANATGYKTRRPWTVRLSMGSAGSLVVLNLTPQSTPAAS
jgi:hypothetical protein